MCGHLQNRETKPKGKLKYVLCYTEQQYGGSMFLYETWGQQQVNKGKSK